MNETTSESSFFNSIRIISYGISFSLAQWVLLHAIHTNVPIPLTQNCFPRFSQHLALIRLLDICLSQCTLFPVAGECICGIQHLCKPHLEMLSPSFKLRFHLYLYYMPKRTEYLLLFFLCQLPIECCREITATPTKRKCIETAFEQEASSFLRLRHACKCECDCVSV